MAAIMDLDFDDSAVRELYRYVRRVNRALALPGECFSLQDDASSVYLALDGRLARYPDRDVALLWDEKRGWAVAVESRGADHLTVVARLGQGTLPPPATVAAWVRGLFDAADEPHPVG